MRCLLMEQVFMPVTDAVTDDGVKSENLAQPLVLESEEGIRVMILFSSLDRARDFVSQFPGYDKGGILMEFHEVLAKMAPNCGISINPDMENGLDLDPDMIQQLINEQAKERTVQYQDCPFYQRIAIQLTDYPIF